jgi:NADPH-dependent 2,4-dienoyl-CoA reductase/sulfur reductase-like enzyme
MTAGSPPRSIVVVGASVAGVAAAEELRRLGHDGPLTVIGEERHAPYDRPPLTKAILVGADPAACALRSAEWPEELDVDLRAGIRAERLDLAARELELTGGERLTYDGLVLATGSTPRRLPGPTPEGAERPLASWQLAGSALDGAAPDTPARARRALDGVFAVRTLDDSLALRGALMPGARLVVVGGGFIGAEVAATARGLGVDVTIVEGEATPLARALGAEVGGFVARMHADEGVEVRCGVAVAGLEGDGRVERVRLADGSALAADVVVVGLGVRPNTAWLEDSGLTIADGVVCDGFCRAAPGVVAAGDVARWEHPRHGSVRIEHWENAVAQGRFAAGALLGTETEPFAPVPYVWSDQYGHKLQIVGRREAGDEFVVVDGSLAERRFVAAYVAGDGRVTAAVTVDRRATAMRIRGLLRAGLTLTDLTAQLEGSPTVAAAATG